MLEATGKDKKEGEERQIVVFNIGNEEFGVSINEVREIIRMEQITRMPNTSDYIKGVINLRGGIIVVIDLAMKLGLVGKRADKNTRIIVIEVNNNIVGMVVDSATEVLRLNESHIKPPPVTITQKIGADYIEGVGILGERLLILLDLGKVLHTKEVKQIGDLQKNAEKGGAINKEKSPKEGPDRDVEAGIHFQDHNGKPIKNINELASYIKGIDESTFRKFVNDEKNDFFNWISNAIGDDGLANKIRGAKSREEMIRVIS